MNPLSNGPVSAADRRNSSGTGEDTLRLIATLPAPEGLEDRVKLGLRSSAETGRIRVGRGSLWPAFGWMYSSFARGAAAAAIVIVVAGGGWQIYSHVQPAASATAVPMQPAANGFSNANAVRVPDSLDPPVLKHPVTPATEINVVEKMPAQTQPV